MRSPIPSAHHPAYHGPRRLLPGRTPTGDEPVLDLGRMLVGLVILAVGTLYLLDAADVLDAGKVVDDWWPAVIVAAGLLTLAERPPAVLRGAVLTAAGAVGLLFTTGVLDEDAWRYVWPLAVIAAGLAVLLRWSGRTIPAGASPEAVIRSTSVFGGAEVASTDPAFRGAWLTAIFGGVTLDLREARPAPEGASVNATAMFGGIDVLVPHGWRVSVRSVPIFGGVEDETDRDAVLGDDAPMLHIDAVCVFGGVGIKHEK